LHKGLTFEDFFQADSLGRLPLHIAAANEGPSHDSSGMPLFGSGSDDWEERHSMSNNGKEMVSMLLRVFPQAAHARDMNGLLPIDWGLRNNSRGMFEIVTELLDANPKCLRVEGGGRTLLADWELVAQVYSLFVCVCVVNLSLPLYPTIPSP
jgi:ankyrin repeat protein